MSRRLANVEPHQEAQDMGDPHLGAGPVAR